MAERTGHNNTLAISLLAGAAGAGLALLFAPRSGRETRTKLNETTQEMKKQVEGSLASAKERLHEGTRYAKDMKDDITGAVKRNTEKRRNQTTKDETSEMDNESLDQASNAIRKWKEEA